MNTLKKWQYSLAIVVAFVSGSLLGLSIGDTWSAVLSGVALAGSMAWILTLDWASFRLRLNELSAHMSVVGAGKAMGGFLFALCQIILMIPHSFIANAKCRRLTTALVFLLGLQAINFIVWEHVFGIFSGLRSSPSVLFFPFVFGMFLLLASFFVVVSTGMIIFLGLPRAYNNEEDLGLMGYDLSGNFLLGWLGQFIESEKSTTFALIDLMLIRGWNALRMLVFPFVFAVWGTYVLATKKTGLSAFCAMSLVSVQLAISHWYGGINAANPNFWLLLVIGAGVGMWLGGKIHDGFDAKISLWNFQKPKLVFASQQ